MNIAPRILSIISEKNLGALSVESNVQGYLAPDRNAFSIWPRNSSNVRAMACWVSTISVLECDIYCHRDTWRVDEVTSTSPVGDTQTSSRVSSVDVFMHRKARKSALTNAVRIRCIS
ncbi:hypothetical protein H113_06072 [Trichophyton rubrum MR1459]|uniref:Uncharacterized protein n=1 Tax=Trichophyton rubrum (strain ATCC MYA-4607 / CBS 118892) TaxID=559305 RepID=A0A080WIT1_TRIRC|nr:uncharacterized protein TERG_12042 [Trichophyton rubrum CBS 118892]EZF93051.1 hypothetical protein H113_06072 [Trichophyton rubrum MR1459]EZG04193.1 hypothetical protein H106_05865 [Trichophyton rubrum CBS 735.88]KFL61309.1 hypothetical protein TERG_12042 [Trichophyton rubrum CBS 118892]